MYLWYCCTSLSSGWGESPWYLRLLQALRENKSSLSSWAWAIQYLSWAWPPTNSLFLWGNVNICGTCCSNTSSLSYCEHQQHTYLSSITLKLSLFQSLGFQGLTGSVKSIHDYKYILFIMMYETLKQRFSLTTKSWTPVTILAFQLINILINCLTNCELTMNQLVN